MTDRERIRQSLRGFVTENFFFGRLPDTFTDDDSFIGIGILDSTGVLELVTFVEKSFQVAVEDDELSPENLDSVNLLLDYIEKKRGGGENVTAPEPDSGARLPHAR